MIHRAKVRPSAMRSYCRARVVEEPSAPRRLFSIAPTARQAQWRAARSGNERTALLLLRFVRGARRSRQLQHGRVLAFAQPGEQSDLSVKTGASCTDACFNAARRAIASRPQSAAIEDRAQHRKSGASPRTRSPRGRASEYAVDLGCHDEVVLMRPLDLLWSAARPSHSPQPKLTLISA